MTLPILATGIGAPTEPAAGRPRTRAASATAATRFRICHPPRVRVCALPPDFAHGLHDEPEFGPLILFRKQIPFHRRREAALRAQREALQRHVPLGLFDAADQVRLRLEARPLAADET